MLPSKAIANSLQVACPVHSPMSGPTPYVGLVLKCKVCNADRHHESALLTQKGHALSVKGLLPGRQEVRSCI